MRKKSETQRPIDINDNVLTPAEAGEIFGVSGWAMYKRAKNGLAKGHYMGRRLYFLKSELIADVRDA